MPKVAVIGAGINGLTTASAIVEKIQDCHVTIFSDKFSPNTASDLSNGLWYPFHFGTNDSSPNDLVL